MDTRDASSVCYRAFYAFTFFTSSCISYVTPVEKYALRKEIRKNSGSVAASI